MTTLEQEIKELREKHAKKEAELIREHEVLSVFSNTLEGYEKPMVHFSRLYGRRGSVHFNFNRYESIRKGKNPDRALLARLLEQFPAVPMVCYKDGCTSFRPEPESYVTPDGRVTITPVGPLTVRIEPASFSQTVRFEWTIMLQNELWEICVEFSMYSVNIGTLNLRYNYYGRRGFEEDIRKVEVCEFTPHAPAKRIRWASGDHKTPNSFTVYWDREDSETIDYPSFIKEEKS